MSRSRRSQEVTALLIASREGDQNALDRLLPLVHEELRALAGRYMRGERQDHTLQATALLNEAYLRLVDSDVQWENRVHFFAVAATTMRRILVDYAKARARAKRGGGAARVTLDDELVVGGQAPDDIVALDEALARLAEVDDRKAKVVELHFFGGLTYDETAAALGISPATVDRDLRMAKAWLFKELKTET